MPYDSPETLSDSFVASPESQTPRLDASESSSTPTGLDGYKEFTIHRQEASGKQTSAQQLRTNRAKINQRNDLHPYVQTLSLSNLESCVALENAVFPEEERCSREKVGPRAISCPRQSSSISTISIYIFSLHLISHSNPASRLSSSSVNASFPTSRTFHIVCIALMTTTPFLYIKFIRAKSENLLLLVYQTPFALLETRLSASNSSLGSYSRSR